MLMPGRYVVVLSDSPVIFRFSSRAEFAGPAAAAYRTQIENRQAAIRTQIEAHSFRVTSSASASVNAMFVTGPAERAAELAQIPGVVTVRPVRKFRAHLNRATQLLNGPAAWSQLGGETNAGSGVKIAILDSGIDQTHPAFQDSSLPIPPGFPICTTGHPEDCAYTNNKVIVARSYVRLLAAGSNPSNPAVDDEPDDYSPRDRDGHGTGVASAAAANAIGTPAVSATGSQITIQGMAPKAYLGNYKIAGSPGVDEFATDETLINAVEDAVKDGMDVITTSWGSSAISSAANDPVAMAFEAATNVAVVTVAAGNQGDSSEIYPSFNTISSPSNAPDVIAVGATENSHVLLPAVSVAAANAPANLTNVAAMPSDASDYPSSQGSAVAPLVDVTQLGDSGLACSALPAYSLNGSFALIERGTCTFAQKARNAQNAGAAGIVFYMADSSPAISPTGLDPNDENFQGFAVMISNADGVNLKNYLEANPGAMTRIAAGAAEEDVSVWSQSAGLSPSVSANQLTSFSSPGPSPEGLIKPDLVATGGNDLDQGLNFPDSFVPAPSGIYMATQSYDPNQSLEGGSDYSANGYWAADGTSFATPLAAGAAALVKQAHMNAGLRGTQIKSLLVNTASASAVNTEDLNGLAVDAESIGAGLLNAGAAVTAAITAEPATISFGYLSSGATILNALPIAKTVKLTNIGSSPVTFSANVVCCTVNGSAGASAASVALNNSSFTLAPGMSTSLVATLSGTAPQPSEYSGSIALQVNGTVVERIPFMYLAGDANPANFTIVTVGGEGTPGSDNGPMIVQVTDQYGVPVANTGVTFAAAPGGQLTIESCTASAACNASSPNEPACSPASSTSSTTCMTDSLGFAFADVVLGSQTGAPQVTITAAGSALKGISDGGGYTIQNAPAVNGVALNDSPTKTLVPGSYISLYGSGLSNTTTQDGTALNLAVTPNAEATDPVIANGPVLPLQIDFVTVSFDVPSAGISLPGHLLYVSPTQINVQVPWELQGQSQVQIKVSIDGDLFGNVFTAPLAAAAPTFYTNNGNAATALDTNYHLITTSNPAIRGKDILLYLNAMGAVQNGPASGDPAGPGVMTVNQPIVMIGGQQANVTFSGLAPGFPGLNQVNVQVPQNIAPGTQNVTLMINGASAPAATLTVQ